MADLSLVLDGTNEAKHTFGVPVDSFNGEHEDLEATVPVAKHLRAVYERRKSEQFSISDENAGMLSKAKGHRWESSTCVPDSQRDTILSHLRILAMEYQVKSKEAYLMRVVSFNVKGVVIDDLRQQLAAIKLSLIEHNKGSSLNFKDTNEKIVFEFVQGFMVLLLDQMGAGIQPTISDCA